jgi:hypothetical protein
MKHATSCYNADVTEYAAFSHRKTLLVIVEIYKEVKPVVEKLFGNGNEQINALPRKFYRIFYKLIYRCSQCVQSIIIGQYVRFKKC